MKNLFHKGLCLVMALCCIAFKGYAGGGTLPDAQGHDLKLSYSRTTLKTVADAITQQVGIVFSYEIALADYPMENLYVTEQGAALDAILKTVFTPRGIDYRVVDKVVVLTRSAHPAQTVKAAPAKAQVTGVVRDAAGNPMIGVTVTVKGTLVGVSTGVDGSYTIPADKDAMLLFSYIGYRNQEEPVGQRTQIDVTMQEDQLVMDEVVVVGYGTLKKRNIVGAVENLAGDAVENRPNADITRSLQGQIPGLNIVQTDGKAAHGGQVTIRGVNNSFKARVNDGQKENKLGQGGSALVLIDGAEGDMSSVNPDDIASISVLKDASSAAVYGARGAFGVILITTKNPEKGKVRVNYNGSVSLHRRTVIWEDNVVTDPVQWVEAFRESYLNSSPTATVPSLFNNYMPYSNAWFEELKRRRADPTMDNYSIDANGNYSYYGETNWLKEIYKSVNYSTTHAVSIQGGREGVSYYVSGRYYNQDGIYKVGEETYKKYNLRAKGSIRIRPWLTLDNNTSLMSSKYHQPMMHYGQQMISRQIDMFAFPFALLKNPDGTWTQTAAKSGYAAFAEGTSWQEDNRLEVANTTTFNFEFVPEVFKVSADVTYKGARWTRDRMENLYTYYTGVNVSGQDNSYSSLENWNYISNYISTNIVGTLTPKLGRDHDLNVVAGWNLEDYDYRAQKTYRQGNLYPSKPSFTLMDGEYYSTTSGGYTWGLVGFFGRINYAYAGRYLVELSARYDGSSKFPANSQWGFFPSASVGENVYGSDIVVEAVEGAEFGSNNVVSKKGTAFVSKTVDISSAVGRFETYTVTLEGLTPASRIAFSSNPAQAGANKTRFLLDDIVVTCEGETHLEQLAAPANVKFDAEAVQPDKLTLKWDAVSGAASYTVACWADGTDESKAALVEKIDGTACTLDKLTPETKYNAKVKAVAGRTATDSDWSAKASATTAEASQGKLDAPANLKAEPGFSTVALTWDAVSGATGYSVTVDNGTPQTVTDNAFTATGLTAGTSHDFSVVALAALAADNSDAATLQSKTLYVRIAAVTTSSIILEWEQAGDVSQYTVAIEEEGDPSRSARFTYDWSKASGYGSIPLRFAFNYVGTEWASAALSPSASYRLRVKAGAADSDSAWSNDITGTVARRTAPAGEVFYEDFDRFMGGDAVMTAVGVKSAKKVTSEAGLSTMLTEFTYTDWSAGGGAMNAGSGTYGDPYRLMFFKDDGWETGALVTGNGVHNAFCGSFRLGGDNANQSYIQTPAMSGLTAAANVTVTFKTAVNVWTAASTTAPAVVFKAGWCRDQFESMELYVVHGDGTKVKVCDTIAVGDAGSELAWKSHSVAIEGLLPTDKLMFTSVGAKKSRYYIDEISVVKN